MLVLMLPPLVWLTPDLRIKKILLTCNWTIRKRLPRCNIRLKSILLAFSRHLNASIRKTRYMHKMRCLLINRRSLLLALRLLWKTPIFPSNSFFFQAEDGIRDGTVTGVQTCALPICTNRTFSSQLNFVTSELSFTDDDGNTWLPTQGSGQPAGVDHQSVGGGPYAMPAPAVQDRKSVV